MRVSPLSIVVVSTLVAVSAHAALCPEPIHIVREVTESITPSTATIHEYCSGNRIISAIRGRVVLTDFARQEVTEIDRSANTFSITSFSDIARGSGAFAAAAPQATEGVGEPRATGGKRTADGRTIETFTFSRTTKEESLAVSVGIDRTITMPPNTVEALIGAAYPNRRGLAHEAMLRAAGRDSSRTETAATSGVQQLALPCEYEIRYSLGEETITSRSTLVLIDRAVAPPELLMIPVGAQRVESRSTAAPRILEQIEGRPPSARH